MAHIFFATRGVQHQRDIWKTHMQAQKFAWKRLNLKTKKEETHFVFGALRPIELWEYVLPEECIDEALTMIQAGKPHLPGLSNIAFSVLRKGLGAKKLKSYKQVKTDKFVPREGLGIEIIGVKKDKMSDKAYEDRFGYRNELL